MKNKKIKNLFSVLIAMAMVFSLFAIQFVRAEDENNTSFDVGYSEIFQLGDYHTFDPNTGWWAIDNYYCSSVKYYEYDEDGNADVNEIQYNNSFDSNGLLAKTLIKGRYNGGPWSANYTTLFSHDNKGRVSGFFFNMYGTTLKCSYNYKKDGTFTRERVSYLEDKIVETLDPLKYNALSGHWSYYFDDKGHTIRMTSSDTSEDYDEVVYSYVFDDSGRPVKRNYTYKFKGKTKGSGTVDISYTDDGRIETNNVGDTTEQYTFNNDNKIVSYNGYLTYSYDRDGNLCTISESEKPVWELTYEYHPKAGTQVEPSTPSNSVISFSKEISYASSDVENDYYQAYKPLSIDDDGVVTFNYTAEDPDSIAQVQVQNLDGSIPEGVTINESEGTERTVTISGLQPEQAYRLYWEQEESAQPVLRKLAKRSAVKDDASKNVALYFRASDVEPDTPEMQLTSSKDILTKNSRTELKVENGKEGYQYKFVIKNNTNGNEWLAQNFNANDKITWFAGPTAGEKTVTVYVQDADGNEVCEPLTLEVVVYDSDLKITDITSEKDTLTASTHTKLTATAEGGQGELQYRFRVYNKGTKKWYTIQDYSTKDNCNWYAGPAAGSKTIYVDVKDASGDYVTKTMDVTVEEPALSIAKIESSLGNSLQASDRTKLTATLDKAGEGTVLYRFRVKNNDKGNWYTIQNYKEQNYCTWYAGPAGAENGKTIYVDVKDSAGNTASLTLDVNVE